MPTALAHRMSLAPGQVVQATVTERLDSGAYRLQLPQGTIDVFSDGAASDRQHHHVAGEGQRAKHQAPDPCRSCSVLPAGQASGTMPRQPIGEAFIVARGNAPSAAPAPTAKSGTDVAVVRDAPSIAPNRPQAPAAPPQPLTPARAHRSRALGRDRQSGAAPLFAPMSSGSRRRPPPRCRHLCARPPRRCSACVCR